jgi:ABC-type uncharacterized transport system substrate-binding protein
MKSCIYKKTNFKIQTKKRLQIATVTLETDNNRLIKTQRNEKARNRNLGEIKINLEIYDMVYFIEFVFPR